MNLIDHLPRNSAYVEAQADDEELAALLLTLPESAQAPRERFSEWSPEKDTLVAILDRLQALTAAVVASGGGKPGTFRPAERPEAAIQRLRRDQRRQRHRDLVARWKPAG